MNRAVLILMGAVLCLGSLSPCMAATEQWKKIQEVVDRNYQVTVDNAQRIRETIRKEKAAIEQKQSELTNRLSDKKKSLNELQEVFASLQKEEEELAKEIESEKKLIQQIKDTVYSVARRTDSIINSSPVTGQYPQRMEEIQPLLDKQQFPGMPGVKILMNILEGEMRHSSQIKQFEHSIVGPGGKTQEADIARIGSLCLLYKAQKTDDVGFLRVEEKGDLYAVSGDPSWLQQRQIQQYLKGESPAVPFDISGGTVFKFLTQKKDFKDWIQAGGILIWPIFAIGAIALLISLERFFYLSRMQRKSKKTIKQVNKLVNKEKWGDCEQLCKRNRKSPICHMVLSMIEHWGVSHEVMENVISESVLRFVPKMERMLPTLGILGAIAPLLGLLGTVTGIINTFQIITMFGTGDPKLMSGGISEALVTTQLGLAVAIPIMLVHHYFRRKVDKIIGETEEKGNAFALKMLKQGTTHGREEESVA